MENKRPVGIIIIGIVEILVGSFNLFMLLNLFIYAVGHSVGVGGFLIYIYLPLSLFALLGFGMLLRKKVALYIHNIVIPVLLVVLIFPIIFFGIIPKLMSPHTYNLLLHGFGVFDFFIMLFPLLMFAIGIFILYYLSRPNVKEQFK